MNEQWIKFLHSKERLQFLSSKISSLQLRPDINELSRLALEILLSRNSAREVLEGDYSKEEKKAAKEALKELENLERKIVVLYGIGRLHGAKWTKHPKLRKVMRKVISYVEEW